MVERAQRRLRALPGRDDDLLVGHRGAVSGREHAGHAGAAMGIDHDLAEARQVHRALEPVGVGQQADLHEDAFQGEHMVLVVRTVLVAQAGHAVAVALHLGGLRVEDHIHVRQAAQLALQHGVGLQFASELQHGDVGHHAGQVDRGLHTGVAAADHRHALALEKRAIAVRAIGHALGAVLLLARHVHVAPACTGGNDHGAGRERAAVLQLDLDQAALGGRGPERTGALQVHQVHLVVAHVLLQRGGELRAIGLADRDVILDVQRVVHLAAEALGRDAGADALAGGIDGRRGTCRAAADDQHVERLLGGQPGGFALRGTGIELADDFLDGHAAGAEHLAVEEHHGYGHDLAVGHFLLEGAALDHGGADAGVEDGHERQRLHHVRAVVAGQAHVDLEIEVAVERLDLLDHVLFHLRRVAARPEQRQHERGEFMAQRQAGEAQARLRAGTLQREGRLAGIVAVGAQADLVAAQGLDGFQQVAHLHGGLAAVQRCHDLERLRHALQIGGKLGFELVVEHGGPSVVSSYAECRRPGTSEKRAKKSRTAWRASAMRGSGRGSARGASGSRGRLDLADQVQRRRQGLGAFLPLGGAHLAGVGGGELGGLELAQGFRHVAGDFVGVDFHRLDDAVRVDHEGAAQCQAFFGDVDAEGVRQLVRRVADQGELGLADGVGGLVPHLVREVRVGGHDVDLGTGLLELGVVVGSVFDLGRAVEREGGRHEDQHGPLALQVLFRDGNELTLAIAVHERFGLERLDLGIDQGHCCFLGWWVAE